MLQNVKTRWAIIGHETPPSNQILFLGREAPNYVELGPYAYKQKMLRTDVSFINSDVLRFKNTVQYKFAPELSEGKFRLFSRRSKVYFVEVRGVFRVQNNWGFISRVE